ncbi:HNH endonuclease signature motif containing protein [Pseudomonas sp. G166]|jgi:5-methylcytosine-specific restriction endonuclease McrA|uniref:HNH endonuclease signature motif containing protein n=1 Tax=Pseudomonas sp. G166 TaxID=3094846 RepID=UPI003008C6A0
MYQSRRPDIPENIRREIEVEAGHECSITTCSEHTYLEIHHINHDREDNRKENLILLCDKHHKMAHAQVIDRKSLRSYKEILNINLSKNGYIRGQEGDRVYRFLNIVNNVLSYDDEGKTSWAGSETGYWFEQEIYLKLSNFCQNIQVYNLELRSYDLSARNRQDRIVDLLQKILITRDEGNYVYNGGYCATFVPTNTPGASKYDNEIKLQKENVSQKLLEIQKLVLELWDYVERRPV